MASASQFAHRVGRWRLLLPLAELLLCACILGPSLPLMLRTAVYSIHLNALNLPEDHEEFFPSETTSAVATVTENNGQQLPNPLVAVSMLNLPALAVQLPISAMTVWPEEWIPRGYFGFLWIWRATSWPLLGVFFWYLVGRSIDALLALRADSDPRAPRMRRRDLWYAIPLALFSLGFAIYAHSANDFDYLETNPLWLSAAGLLWTAFFLIPVLAVILQSRAAGRLTSPAAEISTPVPAVALSRTAKQSSD